MRGVQVVLLAVDCDNTRAALGQQAHGRGADDAGRAGDDGNLAVQTNSIGHVRRFPVWFRLFPDFRGCRRAVSKLAVNRRDYFIRRAG